MYLYDLHSHTAEGSRCAALSGKELAALYAQKGYAGFTVTDHFFGGNTAVDRALSWPDWVAGFCRGWYAAKEEGERLGLQVFFGWEYYYKGTEFLTYGLDAQFLKEHPELREMPLSDYCRLVRRAGGILVHAHPFCRRRSAPVIRLLPEWTDAVETVNKNVDPRANFLADQYADNFNLKKVGGADLHRAEQPPGGVALPAVAPDIQTLFEMVDFNKTRIL